MADGGPYVVLGVMSNPFKPFLRNQWREWASTFNSSTSCGGKHCNSLQYCRSDITFAEGCWQRSYATHQRKDSGS